MVRRGRAVCVPGCGRMGPRTARRRTPRLAAPPTGRTPRSRQRHARPADPRLTRLADGRVRQGPRSVDDPRAAVADRRPDHLLRAYTHSRGQGLRVADDRERWQCRLQLRWRSDRVVGARHDRWRRRDRRDQAHRIRHDGRFERDLGAWPRRRRVPRRHRPNRQARPMNNGHRRVVITGMGAVTALGNDVATTWDGFINGRSGVRRIESFDPRRLTSQVAGEVKDFDASNVLDRKDLRRTERYIQFGLVATRQAMDQARLPERLEGELAERTGVILGTGLGGVTTLFENVVTFAERGPDRISPFIIPMGIPNVGAGQIAISFGPLGPNFTTVSACATGAHALGEAFETIRRNDADVMFAGGTEAGMHEALVGGFCSMKALSTKRNDQPEKASRPFDADRDGFVIGEGAGVLVLEELGHAEARGAEPLAEIVGYGATADASHITLPAPGGIGAVRAARRALEKAGLSPEDVDHVNA